VSVSPRQPSHVTDAKQDFPCRGCGVCCMHMAVPPYGEAELDMLKETLPHIYTDFLAATATRKIQLLVTESDFIPCGFFDMVSRECRHHEHSPEVCRKFDVGSDDCLSFRDVAGLGRVAKIS